MKSEKMVQLQAWTETAYLPPNMREWLPSKAAWFIVDAVESLD